MSSSFAFKLVTKTDAAAIFGVCTKTIDNYIREGRLPEPVQFASRDYWHPDDFQAFLDGTFRRQAASPAVPEGAGSVACPQHGSAATGNPDRAKLPLRGKRDSNPSVRQRARQEAILKELNASG